MEKFRVRVRQETKRGQIWELHLFPNVAGRLPKEADAKVMGSSSSPETIQWLRELSDPFLKQAEAPGPINASDFRPGTPPRWLQHADGMRLALAFASARYLTKPPQREMFRRGVLDLPAEVVLYWFTLCFYGYRQQAGRAALRTLLTYEQAEDTPRAEARTAPERAGSRKGRAKPTGPTLFEDHTTNGAGTAPTESETKPQPKKRASSSK